MDLISTPMPSHPNERIDTKYTNMNMCVDFETEVNY